MKPELPKLPGIYGIQSLINGRIYIGSSVNINHRVYCHENLLNKNRHQNKFIQNHANKYGVDDLRAFVLELVRDKNNLISREQYYLDALNPEFNIRKTANSNYGLSPSVEARKKLSASLKGRRKTRDHVEKVRKALTGRVRGPLTEEWRRKISDGNRGKSITDKQKKQIGDAHRGRVHTEETRQKKRGVNNPMVKLSEADVRSIKLLLKTTDLSEYAIAEKFDISRSTIGDIKHHRIWKHIEE